MAVALAPVPTAHASPQTQHAPAIASQPAAPPPTLQPRGYDPYYRIPAATPTRPSPARHDAPATAHDPPTWWIACSVILTTATLTLIATHVRRTRKRGTPRALV
jgi:hypothetical protein